jgi:hypothetical protein
MTSTISSSGPLTKLLPFNLEKCHSIRFFEAQKPTEHLSLGNHHIQAIDNEIDLGITISSDLSW